MTRSSVTRNLGGGGGSSSAGPTTYRQASNQTTASASLVNSTNLQFTANSSTVYYIDAWVYFGDSGALGTFQMGIVAPTGTTGTWAVLLPGSTFIAPSTSFNTAVTCGSIIASNGQEQTHIQATVHVAGTSGTVAIAICDSGGKTAEIYADSMMVVYSGV